MYRELKKLGFYINYVVCKSLQMLVAYSYIHCFILTMWYVNPFKNIKYKKEN